MKLNRVIVFLIISTLMACNNPLKEALELAGDNQAELVKVLDHFKQDRCVVKYNAACFIIENLPGNYSADTSHLAANRPYIRIADSLFQEGNDVRNNINTTWAVFKEEHRVNSRQLRGTYDYNKITADFLINDIEMAYAAWCENPFKNKFSINDFLEYIVPYRRINNLPIENWRKHFYEGCNTHFKNNTSMPLRLACDSLLSKFKYLKHNQSMLGDYPLLKLEDFENLKRGNCSHKCWYNSMLFAALGVPCAIDFVPAWGNRNAGHSWNVIINQGKSMAFEPFWDIERWKYKRIYNNVSWDDSWGSFRLPKVYRHTYSLHIEGPLLDKRVLPANVPGLFKNFKKKDVSHEYFETVDVQINLTEDIPIDNYYCYLCVFGKQQWQPVQWGKINGRQVTFKGMGKGIVYLPCYCKYGEMIPATDPFLLSSNGEKRILNGGDGVLDKIVVNQVAQEWPCHYNTIESLKGSVIEVADNKQFDKSKKIGCLPDSMLCRRNLQYLSFPNMARFVRIAFPDKQLNLAELSFLSISDGEQKKLVGKPMCNFLINDEELSKVFDGLTATSISYSSKTDEDTLWIGLDFGKSVKLDAISYCPQLRKHYSQTDNCELFVWNSGWQSLGTTQGDSVKVYKKVPDNRLLLHINQRWGPRGNKRVFLYEDGEQKWY